MRLEGLYQIRAPRFKVWESLLDAGALKQAIPGCVELREEPGGVYRVRLSVAAGPVNSVFDGRIGVEEPRPPERCRITITAGGLAGSVAGSAEIELAEAGGATELRYRGEMRAGGMLAALGDRMLERLFRRSLDDFVMRLVPL